MDIAEEFDHLLDAARLWCAQVKIHTLAFCEGDGRYRVRMSSKEFRAMHQRNQPGQVQLVELLRESGWPEIELELSLRGLAWKPHAVHKVNP